MITDERQRYSCKCPVCDKEFTACKSIAQEMGYLDMGAGSCPKCSEYLNLTVDEENKIMIATPWHIYSKNIRGVN